MEEVQHLPSPTLLTDHAWSTFSQHQYPERDFPSTQDVEETIQSILNLSIIPTAVSVPLAQISPSLTGRDRLPAIRACIFDLDGLLLNTEDLYLDCINTILSRYGCQQLPWSVRAKFQGRPNFADCIYRWAQLPISMEQYQTERAELQRQIFPSAEPLPGVCRLLSGLRQRNVQLGLATSSKRVNFELKTKHLPDVFGHFDQRRTIVGSDKRIPKGRGKPHPDIFQLALKMINETLDPGTRPIDPIECLVFEDSLSGVRAAQAAEMRCIWCPHSELMVEIAADPGAFAEPAVREEWAKGEAQGFLARLDSLEDFDFDQYSDGIAVRTGDCAAGTKALQ